MNNRIGEKNINNFGSEMIITGYRNNKDIDIYFPEYDWTFKHAQYPKFKKGNIKCPYELRHYGKGYLGEGKYRMSENGKNHKYFKIWDNMLQRCYDPKRHKINPTYKDCCRQSICVCVERIDYRPISFDEIKKKVLEN